MSLLKSAASVGGFTLASRLLGFFRDQLIAFTFGTGPVAEAFVVAQRLPNLFRALFAEGAFNNAFVPHFSRKLETDGKPAALSFSRDMFCVMATWMIVFCGAAMVAMPWLMPLFAWGFKSQPETLALATELTRICFPYLGFMTLAALFGGVLNSLGRFSAPAAAPILLNIVMILFNLWGWYRGYGNSPDSGRLQAWAITVAGVAQLGLVMYAAWRAGASITPTRPRLTADVKHVIRQSGPGIVSGGVTQINLAIATALATSIPGGAAYLYYADRLFQLPLGVIGVAIGVVLLPTLSRKLRSGDIEGAAISQNRALEFSLFLTLPATAALIIIGRPILHTVFEHGAFTREATLNTSPALAAFAAGLPAFTLSKIFQPGFFARDDMKTPMYFSFATVAINIALSFLLIQYFSHVGIALATAIAAWVNAILLISTSLARKHFGPDARLKSRLPRMLLATAVMAACLMASLYLLEPNYVAGAGFIKALWGLLILLTVGCVSYASAAQITGAFRFTDLKSAFKR